MKLEWLLIELSNLEPARASSRRLIHSAEETETVADEWIRLYVRKEKLAAPAAAEVVGVLLARVCYGVTFAKLLPMPEVELSLDQSVRIVELLMIDCWHGSFREKWLDRAVTGPHLAFAA